MVVPRGLRDRDGRPIINTAVARTFNNVTGLNFPLFGPWGRYYPWFGNGFGWNYGFVSYSPFIYGNTAWLWNRYGFYDPYGMYGYGYDPNGTTIRTGTAAMSGISRRLSRWASPPDRCGCA